MKTTMLFHSFSFYHRNTVNMNDAKLTTIPTNENHSEVELPIIEFCDCTVLGCT